MMSISITTVNIGDAFPFSAFEDLFVDSGPSVFGGLLDSPLLSSLLMQGTRIPEIPTPVSTAGFPDSEAPIRKRTRSSTSSLSKRACLSPTPDCCICLEPVLHSNAATLACKHTLHRVCLFSLMTFPVLGARSMVHCPLCRHALDRYDIKILCDVSVLRLVQAAKRCSGLRKLTTGACSSSREPSFQVAAKLIQGCNKMTADDGFVYNVCVLAIERANTHRLNFARTLGMQLKSSRNQIHDQVEFIAQNLACHIEVLMRTSNQVESSSA